MADDFVAVEPVGQMEITGAGPAGEPEQAKQRAPANGLLLLPDNLGALAKLTAKDSAHWATTAVHVRRTEEGYRAEATDGRMLGVVSGPADNVAAELVNVFPLRRGRS
jgi:hypothetical protein